jgi:mono/diheme cytochrome c family protein
VKTFLKVCAVLLLAVTSVAAIGVSYLALCKPDQQPASAERVEPTPARLARGKYLVQHVTICFDCHAERTTAYGFPVKPGREGAGGFIWNKEIGFPGTLAAANITPDPDTGLGKWTDGEIIRAMREGVDREGNALFAIMPYGHYSQMSDEDAKSIVAYLRTLEPIRYEKPERDLDVPLNFIVKFMPKRVDKPVPPPDKSDPVAYGKYLVTIAACAECHTPKDDRGETIPGMEFAGGWEMHGPNGLRVVTANITPHPETWMGKATKEEFIGRFKAFANVNASNAPQAQKGRNTLMPWLTYSGMTEEDLGAVYAYLKTVKAIEKKVDVFPDAN